MLQGKVTNFEDKQIRCNIKIIEEFERGKKLKQGNIIQKKTLMKKTFLKYIKIRNYMLTYN